MFVTPEDPGEGISAVKALSKAAQQGQRIYHITPANAATVLPNIHIDAAAKSEITAALNAGKEVTTHTDPISVPGWSGAGYVIFDPVTGDGAYKISGGANGGWLLIAVFVFIAVVGFVSFYSGNYIATFTAATFYVTLAKRINELAADSSLSTTEFINAVNGAMFMAVAGVLNAINPVFNMTMEGRLVKIFAGGFLISFNLTWW